MGNELRRGITTAVMEGSTGSRKLRSRASCRYFEKCPTGISVPQQQIPGRTNGHENNKKNLKTLCGAKLVNYLHETIHHLQQLRRSVQYYQYSLLPITGEE
jgi:hypothetical protein